MVETPARTGAPIGHDTVTIRFTKGQGKRDTLTVIRDDGTMTWSALSPNFATHDFMHVALETTLNYRNAFFGLVGDGMDIEAFGETDPQTGRKPVLPAEAIYAETTVQTLWQYWISEDWPDAGALSDVLEIAWQQFDLPAPARITNEQLSQVREIFTGLLNRWDQVLPGETMEVTFAL